MMMKVARIRMMEVVRIRMMEVVRIRMIVVRMRKMARKIVRIRKVVMRKLMKTVKVTFGCTHVALVRRQPQDNLGLLSP